MTNNTPLVTVIIPVYNREKHIKNCLEIVTNQTYKNLEIIVVNDGSSDNSMNIVKQYPSVKIINHPKNKGLAAARNSGIDNANGEYIHFMDDDDKINNSFYEKLLNASIETNADMSCCGMIHQKAKGKTQLFKSQESYTTLHEKLKITYVGKWGYVVRYLFKLNFLKKNNLRFEEGKVIEDLPFSFVAVYSANKIVTVPGAEYLYVYNFDSIINSNDSEARIKRNLGRKHSKQFILNFAKEHGNFKIPGVTTGKLRYVLRKILTQLSNPKTTLVS